MDVINKSAEIAGSFSSVCSNTASYQNFMRASWKEFFEQLPELDGLLLEPNGLVLVLNGGLLEAPFPCHRQRRTITREQCLALNQYSQEIVH